MELNKIYFPVSSLVGTRNDGLSTHDGGTFPSPYIARDNTILTDSLALNKIQFGSYPDQNLYMAEQNVYFAIKKDSTIVTNSSQRDTVEYYFNKLTATNIGVFTDVKDSIRMGNLSWAYSANDAIADSNQLETNKKIVNEIYLRIFTSSDSVLSSADTAALESIAYSTVTEGGDAVYYARAMLQLEITDTEDEEDSRLAGSPQPVSETITTVPDDIIIYPNPAKDEITVFSKGFTDNEQVIIKIYELSGRLLINQKFSSSANRVQLKLSNLSEGLYTISVNTIEKTATQKLPVIK
ncbi:MAG: T9SS type A sorting domain-containing protein [Bacteroidota bacterium]